MRRKLVEGWTRRGALAWALWPVSLLYRLIFGLRRALYRMGVFEVGRVAAPVIVVGNVVAGGGGKTPVVIAIVRHLQQRGYRPGVVSRGYGRLGRDCRAVAADSIASEVGDEPLLIARSTGVPVVVSPKRIDAARHLLLLHPQVNVLVADDGLQHFGLHRDLEVCVFDDQGIGNGLLLPAGPLREPWPRQMDLVLHAGRAVDPSGFAVQRRLACHAVRVDQTQVPLHDLRKSAARESGPALWAVAGIAHPEAFFGMLRDRGLPLAGTMALPDHAAFQKFDWPHSPARTLLCTEKDAVKLWPLYPDALAVPLVVTMAPAFWDALDARLSQAVGAKL